MDIPGDRAEPMSRTRETDSLGQDRQEKLVRTALAKALAKA